MISARQKRRLNFGANISVPASSTSSSRPVETKRHDFFSEIKTKTCLKLASHKMLDSFKLEKAPGTVFCIPNFVTEQEEENTLRNIHKAPKPKWTNLLNRRLQNWGGLPKPKVHKVAHKYIKVWIL